MTVDVLQHWIQSAGAIAMVATLAAIFLGLASGLRRQQEPAARWSSRLIRAPLFYVLASIVYFGFCFLIWWPLPWHLSLAGRAICLLLGTVLYFPGLGLALWARLELGRMYFVSTSFEAPLYADQRLVTTGPFAIVRHPMYLGLFLTGLGGILIYWTWTFVFVAAHFVGLVVRARREDQTLAAALGQEWEAYRSRVPAWIPRFRR